MLHLDSIGSTLREERTKAGVSIEEASSDLDIKQEFLLNIEDGKIGCFKNILELKTYITNYAKYLGLDSTKLIDNFNEYMFEYTSKIPIKEIERQAQKEAGKTNKVASPYTRKTRKYSTKYYYAIYIVIFLLVILAIIWSIKQITIDSHEANVISYVNFK